MPPSCLRAGPAATEWAPPPTTSCSSRARSAAAVSPVDPSQVRRAGPVLLRPDQPRLHPGPAGATRASSGAIWSRASTSTWWTGDVPTEADHGLTLEDYVCVFLRQAIDFVLRQHAAVQDLHLVGYCMGGTMAALFAALEPATGPHPDPAGGADRLHREQSLLNLWTDPAAVRRRCLHRHLPELSGLVSPVLFPEHAAGPELPRAKPGAVRADGRPAGAHATSLRWSAGSTTTFRSPARPSASSSSCLYQRNELVRGEFHLGPAGSTSGASSAPCCC